MRPRTPRKSPACFFGANASERVSILHSLADTPLKALAAHSARPRDADSTIRGPLGNGLAFLRRRRNLHAGDRRNPDPAGAKSRRRWSMIPAANRWSARQRHWASGLRVSAVLLFLKPEIGTSVTTVYRLSRMYDDLSERSALVMLAALARFRSWRSPRQISAVAVRRRTLPRASVRPTTHRAAARLQHGRPHGHAGLSTLRRNEFRGEADHFSLAPLRGER